MTTDIRSLSPLSLLAQAWRMTVRDWRAGELRLLAMALVIAVASVSSVGFLADRIRQALERDAAQLLGGDVVLISDNRVDPGPLEEARRLGLSVTENLQFPSMASVGTGDAARSQLAALKAVRPGYPLRGSLRVADGPTAPDEPTREIPAPGTAWVDPRCCRCWTCAWATICNWGTGISASPG